MTVPCKGCRERRAATKTTPSCHADCERYRAWKNQVVSAKADARKDTEALDVLASGIRKIKHSKQRRGLK